MKKIIITVFSLVLLFVGQTAFANVTWNTDPTDCPGSGIGIDGGAGVPAPGSNDCWNLTSVSGNTGDSVNVQLYYHNTGNQPATNTKVYIHVSPSLGTASTTHTFTSSLSASPSGTSLGTTTLHLSTAKALSIGSNDTWWYPNQTASNPIKSGAQITTSSGLYLGTINNGWSSQGTVVAAFKVGSSITPPPPAPTCLIENLSAEPATVTAGGSSTIFWNTVNCSNVKLNGVPVTSWGSKSFNNIQTATTYTLTGTNSNGRLSSKSIIVSVNTTPTSSCLLEHLSASPSNIPAGGNSTIFWNTVNCSNVKLNGVPVTSWGSKPFSNIQSTTTYTLTGNSSNGTTQTKNTVVTVNAPTSCSLADLSASPSNIPAGGNSTIFWNTVNCSNVKLNGVPVTSWGSKPFSNIQSTTTYTLTGNSSNGTTQTKNVIVTVNPIIVSNCTINSFFASPTTITSGQSSNLSWNTSNCNYVKITSGVLSNSTNYPAIGSLTVSPTQTTTYILTAYGANGITKTKTATVIVRNTIAPSCLINSFTTDSTNITSGQSATLSWTTTNCTTVSLGGSEVSTSSTKEVHPTQTTTYTLTAHGATGTTQTRSVTIYVNTVVFDNCLITKFSANPTSITSGGSSVIGWNTNNCTTVNLNGNEVPSSGSKTVWPVVTTTYTLVAGGLHGGVTTQSVTVYVNTVAPNYCMINNFSASPTSIVNGNSSVLYYSTSDCLTVSIVPEGGDSLPMSGTQTVWPTHTTTYILTAQGANGMIKTQSVTVYVNTVLPDYCIINDFSANPTSITKGDLSVLNWDTTNCSNVSLSGTGVSNSGSKTVWPTHTTTYTLTANGTTGTTQIRSVTVYVNQIDNDTCEIINFDASDTSIEEGDYSTLSWNTNNCDHVKITVLGNVDDDGSEKVYPTSDKTYTLTAYDSDGGTQTDTVRIYVDENNNNNDSDCSIDSFTASDTYIQRGDDVTLRWRTTDCDDVSISEIGNVDDDGSETVSPRSNTTYTLRAYGDGGNDSDSIRINVDYNDDGGYYNPPVYNTNVVTTVATNITQNSAQINGLITSSSYNNATTYFEYGTDVNLGLRTASRTTNGNTNFSEYLTNLSPRTIYYFRAVAEGQNGLSRGAIEVFQTLGYVNTNNSVQTIRQIVYQQGPTISGSESPIVLRIENRYQTIGVGDTVDYTVFYKNISSSTLTNPMVQVFVPQGMTFTNSSRGTYSQENKTLSVPIEDLRPDDEGIIYLQTRVDSIDPNMAQIVTTAILIYTNPNGAQENAMAYVLNNPKINNLLGASAFFGNMFGMGLVGWLLLIILIMIIILISRTYGRRNTVTTTTHKTIS